MDFNALINRVKNILLSPKSEWQVIAAETHGIEHIYKNYVIPLALLAAIGSFLGGALYMSNVTLGSISIQTSKASFFMSSMAGFVLSLLMTYVLAQVVSYLAPKFGGTPDLRNAFKVCAYSYTASWVGMMLMIIPGIGLLAGLVGLYGIYLFYLGLPALMKNPEDKSFVYTLATVVCAVVLNFVAGLIMATLK